MLRSAKILKGEASLGMSVRITLEGMLLPTACFRGDVWTRLS